MADLLAQLTCILNSFDERLNGFEEYEVESQLHLLKKAVDQGVAPPFEIESETIAFALCPKASDNASSAWATYYGPMLSIPTPDGSRCEFPNLQQVSSSMLDYWAERARITRHPMLRARYADIVWDLCKKIDGRACPPDIPRIMIDATLQLAARHLYTNDVFVIRRLERALSVALSLRDDARVCAVRDAIIAFEDSFASDRLAGTWGFSFDLLMENVKIPKTPGQEKKIISDLDSRLTRLVNVTDDEQLAPHCVEGVALRLARYYRRINSSADVQRIMLQYASAYLRKSASVSGFVAAAWLRKVYETLQLFNLKAEAEQIAVKFQEYAKKGAAEMKPISITISIDNDELAKFLNDLTEGDTETALFRLAGHFIPDQNTVRQQVLQLTRCSPLNSLIPRTVVDHEGRPVADLGPVADDFDAHVVSQISQNMKLSAMFLRMTFEKLIADKQLGSQHILAYLQRSPLFGEDQWTIIDAGLQAFFEGNWIVAIHLLVSQIEKAVRDLLQATGGSTIKEGRNGATMLKILDELLRDERVAGVLGDDTTRYLQILLTDKRGWNVRNNVCHALVPACTYGSAIADRLVHAILVVGSVCESSE